ncbi:MAG: hypothetical protein WD295_01575 [Bacteroidota bacterium]
MAHVAALFVFTLVFTLSVRSQGISDTPYAGEQTRNIKALSDSDIQSYRTGAGMGLAKAAELNHYPGPLHVLALADELRLTTEQRTHVRRLMENMKEQAIPIGERIVQLEARLDSLFSLALIDTATVRSLTRDIALLQAALRSVHLEAHLAQRALLSTGQVDLYDRLRGYSSNTTPHTHH